MKTKLEKTTKRKPAGRTRALAVAHGSASDTPLTDRLEYEQECNFDVPWEDHCRELERKIARLCLLLTAAHQALTDKRVLAAYCINYGHHDYAVLEGALRAAIVDRAQAMKPNAELSNDRERKNQI